MLKLNKESEKARLQIIDTQWPSKTGKDAQY